MPVCWVGSARKKVLGLGRGISGISFCATRWKGGKPLPSSNHVGAVSAATGRSCDAPCLPLPSLSTNLGTACATLKAGGWTSLDGNLSEASRG